MRHRGFVLRSFAVALQVFLAACSLSSVDSLGNGVCPAGRKACNGACVRDDVPEYGCKASGCIPCVIQNASAICSSSGACTIAVCNKGFTDCNERSDDGCEVETDYDVDNCGKCNKKCEGGSNWTPACSAGACTIGVCTPPAANCNDIASDGCEVGNLNTDNANCGRCHNACPSGQTCSGGSCS